jgi:hypothetical protein
MKEEIRYSKKDLMKLWGVSRYTISEFEKRGLNFIEISSHSKFITHDDLLEFENSKRKNKLIQ